MPRSHRPTLIGMNGAGSMASHPE